MKSLCTYISEQLIIRTRTKQKITPTNRQELNVAILNCFKHSDGDLNHIDVSKLKDEEDFYCLFYGLRDEIKENNITEIDISDWELKELYYDENSEIGMFQECETLQTVILPNCLEVIGKQSFHACINLNNITIPESVTSIDGWAFATCRDLNSVIISDSIQSIGDWAFLGCNKLTITVPNRRVKKLVDGWGFNGKIKIK